MKRCWFVAFSILVFSIPVIGYGASLPCKKISEKCVDGPSTKVINGISHTKDCWNYESTYGCDSIVENDPENTCKPLRDKGCQQVGSACKKSDTNGCVTYEQTYSCVSDTKPGRTYTDCGTQTFCAEGNCFDTSYKKDEDFAKAISGIEILREAGQYPDEQGKIFKGFSATCNNKLSIGSGGNCCAARTAGGSNLTDALVLKAATYAGSELVKSHYTYNILFASDAPQWALDAFGSFFGTGQSSAFASLIAGDISVAQYVQGIDPTTAGLYAAYYVYSSWVQCEEKDLQANMKRDSGLCHFVGSYCSSSLNLILVKICLVNTQAYCCFNSKLARIFQEQVRPQLGMDWGSGEQPNCSPLDVASLQMVDWAKVDLSEFYSEIKAKMPAQTDLVQKSQQKYQNYFLQK